MIREAELDDLSQLLYLGEKMRLESKTYYPCIDPIHARECFIGWLESEDCCFFVIDEGGGLVGFISGYVLARIFSPVKTGTHDLFYILPEHRSLRRANSLFGAFSEWAVDRGAMYIESGFTGSYDLSRFLERQGLEKVGEIFKGELPWDQWPQSSEKHY